MCLLGSLIHAQLPVWLKGDAKITGDAGRYFLSFSWMLPFTQLCSLTSSFLQCAGDMLTPSILNAVMCVLDVAFNALLIPRLGVFGAGLGTMLACAVVAVVMVILCCFRNESLRFRSGEHHPVDGAVLKTALRIGTPVALQEVAMCGAQVVSTAIIAPLGALAVAANAFAVTAESICYMPGYGIANAAAALVGRSVGAGDMESAMRDGNICISIGAFLMTCTGAVMMFLCPLVFGMLTPVADVQQLAARVLRIELLAEPLFGASIVAAGALRGAGDTKSPFLITLFSMWGVRILGSFIFVRLLGKDLPWVCAAMCTDNVVRFVLFLARYLQGKWAVTYAQNIRQPKEETVSE